MSPTHSTDLHSAKARQAGEYLHGWQHAKADLENFRRRMQSEAGSHRTAAKRELIESLITLIDNFQALTSHVPQDKREDPWVQGVLHVARQFETTLQDFGVSVVSPAGEEFDPSRHEAIEQVKQKNIKSGQVAEVIQPGYMLGEVIIRPAKVKVAT